ncbi:MAG TPA: SUKH-3 domain-containing protein, partial [Cryptosporangiaceae bacterium]|nr:SUKH-3 domain-containing protein [Cryptosporangiaceae bacterium]
MAKRLPAAVAKALRAGGWDPDAPDRERAREWGFQLAAMPSPDGLQHSFFTAAEDALAEFGGVRAEPPGPGTEVAPSGFTIDPTRVIYTH